MPNNFVEVFFCVVIRIDRLGYLVTYRGLAYHAPKGVAHMGPDLLTTIFTVSFWFGAGATILNFVFGVGRHGPDHLPGLGDLGGHDAAVHDPSGHGSVNGDSQLSPLNLTSILAFLVVFGAVGLALQGGVTAIVALILATLAGLVGGWLAFLFIAKFLLRGQTFLKDEPLIGTVGMLSIPIDGQRVGEIIYTRNGTRRSDGARSVNGESIGPGEEVVIVSYANGIATVQRWREYLNGGK